MHAIPTTYSGVQFRSRLEARWAAFFDLLKIKWLYEPFDLAGYIPDFILPEFGDLLVEVKPILHMSESSSAMDKIRSSGWTKNAVVVGADLWTQPLSRSMGGGFTEVIDVIGSNIAAGACYDCAWTKFTNGSCYSNCERPDHDYGAHCPEESVSFYNLGMFTGGKFQCLRNGHRTESEIAKGRALYGTSRFWGEDYLSESDDVKHLWKRSGNSTQWKGKKARP